MAILVRSFDRKSSRFIGAARLMRKTLGGIQLERGLGHEVQLMVMHSNAIVCARDPRQPYCDERCIRMPSCAEVLPGKLICSCPMHSNVLLCWPGLLKRIAC